MNILQGIADGKPSLIADSVFSGVRSIPLNRQYLRPKNPVKWPRETASRFRLIAQKAQRGSRVHISKKMRSTGNLRHEDEVSGDGETEFTANP